MLLWPVGLALIDEAQGAGLVIKQIVKTRLEERVVARDYLQQVLQRPYSQLRFGPQGLTLAK